MIAKGGLKHLQVWDKGNNFNRFFIYVCYCSETHDLPNPFHKQKIFISIILTYMNLNTKARINKHKRFNPQTAHWNAPLSHH